MLLLKTVGVALSFVVTFVFWLSLMVAEIMQRLLIWSVISPNTLSGWWVSTCTTKVRLHIYRFIGGLWYQKTAFLPWLLTSFQVQGPREGAFFACRYAWPKQNLVWPDLAKQFQVLISKRSLLTYPSRHACFRFKYLWCLERYSLIPIAWCGLKFIYPFIYCWHKSEYLDLPYTETQVFYALIIPCVSVSVTVV